MLSTLGIGSEHRSCFSFFLLLLLLDLINPHHFVILMVREDREL